MQLDFGRIFHFALNVSDMDRSVEYYKGLGFKVRQDFVLDEETTAAACEAFGSKPHRHRGVWLQLGDDPRATVLDLAKHGAQMNGKEALGIAVGFAGGLLSDKVYQSRRGPPVCLANGVIFVSAVTMAFFLYDSPPTIALRSEEHTSELQSH